jgi:3-hydroxyacyl-CoA dehydrogenase
MHSPVRFETELGIGIVTIDSPPVNAISARVTTGLQQAIDAFEADPSLEALVICCAGKTFVAGGDIKAFEDPDFSAQPYNRTLARIEQLNRPVVAALHGTVLGGGLELAMACHARVALSDTQLGLPEVKLGLLPGSLGTQRLPRLVPVAVALEMMVIGKPIPAERAYALELVDKVVEGSDARAIGLAFAREMVLQGRKGRVTSQLAARSGGLEQDFFAKALNDADYRHGSQPAVRAIVECVQAAVESPFEIGEKVEAQRFDACVKSPQSRALRHIFFAEREAARIPGLPTSLPLREVRKIGVVGAGTMGGGIAMNFLNIGVPTILLDTDQAALDRGFENVQRNYDSAVAKGRLSEEELRQRMLCLQGTLTYSDLADCDLVVEAVFEDMTLKKQVMTKLGAICKRDAIIATNTSTLDVDALAAATGRPSDVVGMHFFSPANVMRLLEVVRGAQTAPEILASAMRFGRRIGKVSVVSGVCYGFIGNRMLEPYLRETEALLLEGAQPQQIDRAIESLGFAMGPCRMLDMAGVDVGAKIVNARAAAGALPNDSSYRVVVRKLFELGRYGQKAKVGFYTYSGHTPSPDPELLSICEGLAHQHRVQRRDDISDQEIIERLIYPLINEGMMLLDEGIAIRPGDVDVVWVAGYGFPGHRGGPMFMADELGLSVIADRLTHYASVRGNEHGYWTPCSLLRSLEKLGVPLSSFQST